MSDDNPRQTDGPHTMNHWQGSRSQVGGEDNPGILMDQETGQEFIPQWFPLPLALHFLHVQALATILGIATLPEKVLVHHLPHHISRCTDAGQEDQRTEDRNTSYDH